MNCFGDKIVFARIKEGRDQLIAQNAALRQALEAAGFDCEDRYIPHVTVMKVRREKAGIKRNKRGIMLLFQTGGNAQAGIPRDAFNQFVDHNYGTQVLHTEHGIIHVVFLNCSPITVYYKLHLIKVHNIRRSKGSSCCPCTSRPALKITTSVRESSSLRSCQVLLCLPYLCHLGLLFVTKYIFLVDCVEATREFPKIRRRKHEVMKLYCEHS